VQTLHAAKCGVQLSHVWASLVSPYRRGSMQCLFDGKRQMDMDQREKEGRRQDVSLACTQKVW
jgi:hypothetical protein